MRGQYLIFLLILIVVPSYSNTLMNTDVKEFKHEHLIEEEDNVNTDVVQFNETIYCYGTNEGIVVINNQLEELWKISDISPVLSLTISPFNDIIFYSYENILYCYNISGFQIWNFSFSDRVQSSIGCSNDSFFISIDSTEVDYVYRMSYNGDVLWKKEFSFVNEINIFDEINVIILQQLYNNNLISCINKTGVVLWEYHFENQLNITPIIFNDDIVISDGKDILLINGKNGSVTETIETLFFPYGKPLILNDSLLISDKGQYIYYISLENHSIIWNVMVGLNQYPDFLVKDDSIYYSANLLAKKQERSKSVGKVYQIDLNGNIIGEYEIETERNPTIIGKVIIIDDNTILIRGVNNSILLIDDSSKTKNGLEEIVIIILIIFIITFVFLIFILKNVKK